MREGLGSREQWRLLLRGPLWRRCRRTFRIRYICRLHSRTCGAVGLRLLCMGAAAAAQPCHPRRDDGPRQAARIDASRLVMLLLLLLLCPLRLRIGCLRWLRRCTIRSRGQRGGRQRVVLLLLLLLRVRLQAARPEPPLRWLPVHRGHH